jgi:hypothetical protein
VTRSRVLSAFVVLAALLVGAPAGASAAAATPGAAVPAPVPSFGSDSTRCALDDDRINESSGLAVSTRDPTRLWTHNDSGDTARIFALGPPVDGKCPTVGVINMRGVDAFDAEDLAPGPNSTLWLADIGDNIGQRQRIVLDRVIEPVAIRGETSEPAQRFRFAYPDGPHNAEALLVGPRTGQVVIVTKGSSGTPRVYEAPGRPAAGTGPAPADVRKLSGSGELDAPGSGGAFEAITGGAVSPDGSVIVLRTYLDAYVYPVAGDDLVAALHTTPRRIGLPPQPQGEGVAFAADGKSILLSSEGVGTSILSLRRESGEESSAGRLVGGNRNLRPVLVGVAVAAVVVGLVLFRLRRRRRRR